MNKMISQRNIMNTALATAVLLASACMPEDDFQDIEVLAPSPSLSLPLLNTNLRVDDLIKTEDGGLLEQKPDGTYSLFYRQTLQTISVDEFFPPIPAQQFAENFSLGFSAPSFDLTSSEPITFEGEIPLDFDELTVYKIECKQGDLNVAINSDYDHDVFITLTLLDLFNANQEPLILDFQLKWGNKYSVKTIDLSGYNLNVNQEKIRYSMEVMIEGRGGAIDVTDQISLDLNMANIAFSYIEGGFDDISIPIDADTLMIPVLPNVIEGDVALNPNLKIDFINSFGVPILPDLSNIFVERKSGVVVQLKDEGNSQFFSGNFEIPYLKDRNELPAMKSQKVDRNNSNLDDAFAELPRGLAYLFGFSLNGGENDTSFIADDSSIGIDMEVELPLEGRFDIVLEDTIEVDLGFEQEVEELKVLIKTENGFPIDSELQVFFLDQQGKKMYDNAGTAIQLFDDQAQLLKAAQIINSATGETQAAVIDMPISASINKEKYELIKNAGSVLVQARMVSNSEDEGMVKLYSSYNIRFSLAMQIKSSLNISN